MSQPIRVLHFADIHIGMENYGKTDPQTGLSSRVVDFLRRLDEMIEYAAKRDVDLIVFAGDAFKTRTPNPTYQREFAWRVRDLSQIAPLVLLVGNHDLPPTVLKASSIEIYDTLAVPNVWVANEYEVRQIDTKRGPVMVGAAPYPIRSRLLEDARAGMTIAQSDAYLQEVLTRILDDLAAEADQPNIPRLLTGHFTVSGAVVGSERQVMLGRDVAVSLSAVADPRWDYVAMGHIHKFQNLTAGRADAPPVVYSGSMERIDFGEEGDAKGFCWVELARGATHWEFVELQGVRPFVTLRADLREDHNPTQTLLRTVERHDLQNAIVRVLLDVTPESAAKLNEGAVRDALKTAGVNHVAVIRKEVEQPARARLGSSPEGLTPPELLDRYLLAKGVTQERREELIAVAQSIFDGQLE